MEFELTKKQDLDQLRIRQYKTIDAEQIVSWIKDEKALRKWSTLTDMVNIL